MYAQTEALIDNSLPTRPEKELVAIGEDIIEALEETNITYLPNRRWVRGCVKHHLNPRHLVLHKDDFHYLVEYIIEYFAS